MKTPSIALILCLLLSRAPAADCPAADCAGAGGCAAVAGTSALTLSAEARTALLFQIEEERMAGELYRAWGRHWALPPFANIPRAEARHEAALRQLATRAGVTVPEAQPGRFASAEVQARYDALLAQGSASREAALRAGAYVEEQDIADLRRLQATTDNAELRTLATNLARASGHHLTAFVRGLKQQDGLDYQAQVLPAAEVTALLQGPGAEACGPRGGGAPGGRRGRD